MRSLQALPTRTGFTHASNVIPVLKCNDAESFTVTSEVEPLKTSALPYLPFVVQFAVLKVPRLVFPDESATFVPVPSSNEYEAMRPGIGAGKVVATHRNSCAPNWLAGMLLVNRPLPENRFVAILCHNAMGNGPRLVEAIT